MNSFQNPASSKGYKKLASIIYTILTIALVLIVVAQVAAIPITIFFHSGLVAARVPLDFRTMFADGGHYFDGDQVFRAEMHNASSQVLIFNPPLLLKVHSLSFQLFQGIILWLLLFLLRRILKSVKDDEPFMRDNGQRIKWIAYLLMILTIAKIIQKWLVHFILTPNMRFESVIPQVSVEYGISTLLIALIILIIGHVFTIGAAMRDEQQLTV